MKEEWLCAALEEYKTLRAESLESIKGQQSTLRVGLATVGLVIATGFNLWSNKLLPDLIFLLFNPFLCYLVLIVWIGEVSRMMRAGYYLSLIENKINAIFPDIDKVIYWENWLRSKDAKGKTPQMKLNYLAIIAIFFLTALSSIIIGNVRIIKNTSYDIKWLINIFEFVFFITSFIYILKTGKRFEKM